MHAHIEDHSTAVAPDSCVRGVAKAIASKATAGIISHRIPMMQKTDAGAEALT